MLRAIISVITAILGNEIPKKIVFYSIIICYLELLKRSDLRLKKEKQRNKMSTVQRCLS